MPFIDDPNAEARSLMMRAACVCSGEKNGIRCKNYWALMQKFYTSNADVVRDGKKRRNCTMVDGFMLEFDEKETPTYCQRYEPLPAPGLVNIARRAVRHLTGTAPKAIGNPETDARANASSGYVGFDKAFEVFRPMTLAEIEKLRKENPDQPVDPGILRFAGLQNPFDVDAIAGAQIGIIPTPAAQAIREEAARLVADEGMDPLAAHIKAMEPKVSPSLLAALDGDEPPNTPTEKQ